MFESAELGHSIDKQQYKREAPALREALLEAQYHLAERKDAAVVIVIAGVDGAGKGETVNLINEWMDPRKIATHAFGPPNDEARDRPPMWRYWRALPPKGEIGILFGSWYSEPLRRRVHDDIEQDTLDSTLTEIVRFEKMLADEGVLLIKLWFHLSKDKQKARIQALQKNPDTRWRVTEQDLRHLKLYGKFRKIAGHVLNTTGTAEAPWTVIEGFDANYRNLAAGKHILQVINRHLEAGDINPLKTSAPPLQPPLDHLQILAVLDLSGSLDKKTYEAELAKYQRQLNLLTRHKRFKNLATTLVFEGADAAGKGGSIRRITQAIDARIYNVIPIAAPTEEERAQPYLWRFWRNIPGSGEIAIFDRSWYGRVLVERVEGLCSEEDWQRAYAEINDFERQLIAHDGLVIKFWLQISEEEQLRRFEARQQVAYKRFKITEEDWRNRGKWQAYQAAASDMIDRTGTDDAPWILVEANDKHFARIKILRSLCERLEQALEDKHHD
jgi:polyphosphate:AMP phosphotransferase